MSRPRQAAESLAPPPDPHERAARCKLAMERMEAGQLEEAESLFRLVLAAEPSLKPVRMALSECLFKRSDWPKAYENLETLLRLDAGTEPESPRARYERGLLDLLFGRLPEGWEGHEARLDIPGQVGPRRAFAQPRWAGQPFAGKTLLIHYEQGFGDTLMFLRYLPRVKAQGGRVLLEVQPPLAGLATTCAGVDMVLLHGEPLPPFDLQLSLLSLPLVFRTAQDTIPGEVPYLDVPGFVPNRQGIAELLADSAGQVRVGLVWSGRSAYKNDAARSLPRAALAPLAAVPGVAWHSFQLGDPEPAPLPGCRSLAPLLTDFSDTAYALSGMDLVITVDTAVAHLAGALAIPTLLLLPFFPDWRWMLGRNDTPWYPSLRLYRQTDPGDWGSVIQQLVADLTQEA